MSSQELKIQHYKDGILLYCDMLKALTDMDGYIKMLIKNENLPPLEQALRDYLEGIHH